MCTEVPVPSVSKCACGRRHLGKRACIHAAHIVTNIQLLNVVPRGQAGRCPFCRVQVTNGNKHISHLRDFHGYRAPERTFAGPSGVCPWCLKCFSIRPRLLDHLANSGSGDFRGSFGSVCFKQLALMDTRGYTEEQMLEHDEVDRELIRGLKARGRSSKATEGTVYYKVPGPRLAMCEGPLPPWTARVPVQPI